MPLFEVVILQHPVEKEKKEGKLEIIVVDEKLVARDETMAVLSAVLKAKEKGSNFDLDRAEVLVRPFGK